MGEERGEIMETGDNQKDWGEIETRRETSCRVGQDRCERRDPEQDRQQDRRGEQRAETHEEYRKEKNDQCRGR